MSTSPQIMQALIEKISNLPNEQLNEVIDFLEFLQFRQTKKSTEQARHSGCWAGKIWIADDFDAPLPPAIEAALYGEVA